MLKRKKKEEGENGRDEKEDIFKSNKKTQRLPQKRYKKKRSMWEGVEELLKKWKKEMDKMMKGFREGLKEDFNELKEEVREGMKKQEKMLKEEIDDLKKRCKEQDKE